MIPRKLSKKLLQLLDNKNEYNNVILLEGARQVGKTTLIRKTLENNKLPFKEINLEEKRGFSEKIDQCENFDEFSELIQIEEGFHIGGDEILFIDEAQESTRLSKFIRFMKEKWKSTQVILSGSSMARIFKNDVRFPVGRVAYLHLHPLTFSEFLTAEDSALLQSMDRARTQQTISAVAHENFLKHLDKYTDVGGLPEVVTTYLAKKDWQSVRDNILFGYYSDFKRIFGEDLQPYFVASLKTTANLLGHPFKNSYISRLLDGGKNTKIIESLAQLEAWKMLFKVDQVGPSPTTNFHPKRYLFDLGIAKQLRESAIPSIKLSETLNSAERTPLGGLIENMTLLGLTESVPDICGWKKSSSGSEVDFVLKLKEAVIPFECKAASKIKNSHLHGLLDYMDTYNIPLSVVVSLAPLEVRILPQNRRILILPLYLIEYWKEIIEKL